MSVKCKCRLTLDDATYLLNERVIEYVKRAGPHYLTIDVRGFLRVIDVHARVRHHNVEVLLEGDKPLPVLVYNGAGRVEWINLHDIPNEVKAKKSFFLYPRHNGTKRMEPFLGMNEDHYEIERGYTTWLNSWCSECDEQIQVGDTVCGYDLEKVVPYVRHVGTSGLVTFTPAS